MRSSYKKILLKAKSTVYGQSGGIHQMRKKGFGFDFFEMKEYEAGDDVRRIDWNASARTESVMVRVMNEERDFRLFVVVCVDGNALFGREKPKLETMAEVFALLGYSALSDHNPFGWAIVGEEVHFSPFSKHEESVEKGVLVLENLDFFGKCCAVEKLGTLLSTQLTRRTLIVIIGDFLTYDPLLKGLAQRHEVLMVQIRDSLEEKGFSYTGRVASLVNLKEFFLNKKKIRKNEEYWRTKGVRFCALNETLDPFLTLNRFMDKV